jgi:hypothetical protein
MTVITTPQLSVESLIADFFRRTEGSWNSQRRYYTLNGEGETQEVVSFLTVRFLTQGSPELVNLAELHQLEDKKALICGTKVTWESHYTQPVRKPSEGATIFGVLGNSLYRDQGFATSKPVIAKFFCPNPDTLVLKTEYNGSAFEEEIKLIGQQYRTRQTIISRAGQEQMIGQYLEKRLTNS